MNGNDLKSCRESLDLSNRCIFIRFLDSPLEKRTFIRIGSDIESIVTFGLTGDAEDRGLFTETRRVIRAGSSFARNTEI